MSITDIRSKDEFDKLLSIQNYLVVVHFWSEAIPQCQQINDVISEMLKNQEFQNVKFAKVEAGSLAEIFKTYNVSEAPTCILFLNKQIVDVVGGADVTSLTKKVKLASSRIVSVTSNTDSDGSNDLESRLKALINKSKIMVFMKGSPNAPRCGFSRTLVGILNELNAKYETFDILEDEEVRQGLKTFSNWPTYPQVYVNGEFIGGLDIIKELKETGEIYEALNLK